MALSETATRIVDSLPIWYHEDPILLRIMQAWANEVDRLDDLLDRLQDGLVPALASDDLGMLGIWEHIVRLPVNPPDATEGQRRGKVLAIFRSAGSGSAAGYIATITAAIGTSAWRLIRDSPGDFQDTLEVPFLPDSYNAVQVLEIARRVHQAHRRLFIRFTDGFILDASPLDEGVF